MRIPRLYLPDESADHADVPLGAAAFNYLTRVLRLRQGAELIVFDGHGRQCSAQLTRLEKKAGAITLHQWQTHCVESPLSIHLGIAVSRGERMDWVIQKATELGVTTITPLVSERTEVKLQGDRADKKIQHWQQIAISACEQCGRNQLPLIHPTNHLQDWCTQVEAQQKWVLHHRTKNRLGAATSVDSAALLIGPEGGLSEPEITLAETQGFAALQLGPRVLRTETAPIAAITLLQYVWGDFR